jgi:hypothetical protein
VDVKPRVKHIDYTFLSAHINYAEHQLTITNIGTGESLTIPAGAYPELQAIMADIGHQVPVTPRR